VNKPDEWSWRAKAKGNHEILAHGESYINRDDMMDTLVTLFGNSGVELVTKDHRGQIMSRTATW
jgi:uncharacterized protein YegP (UPF0339 family)